MSAKDLTRVIERASTDGEFLNQLNANPDAALKEYSLSVDERAALISGDSDRLEALGVDARISKRRGFN